MQASPIRQQLRRFIVENYLLSEDYTFGDHDSFLEHGIIDSTGVLQLVEFLEDTYGITVEDTELTPENLDSIDAVSAYLHRKLGGLTEQRVAPASDGVLGGAL